MLVVTRKPGEVVVIGDHLRLSVVAVHGRHAHLGLTAPADVPIRRAELRRPCKDPGQRAGGQAGAEVQP
jgi:carbon storage regulator